MELRAAADSREAEWVAHAVRDARGDYSLGSVLPTVFEDYARVFHPAMLCEAEVRWADVASANGRVMHPAAEWGSLTGSWQLGDQPDVWDQEPPTGELPERLAERLAETLAPYTREADRCLLGVWEGWGISGVMMLWGEGKSKDEARRVQETAEAKIAAWHDFVDGAPMLALPAQREMRLLEGPLGAVSELYEEQHRHPPSLWWPSDRAWCVGTDIDLMTSYVGGSSEAISALLDDEQLEALRLPVDQCLDWAADTINPLPKPPA